MRTGGITTHSTGSPSGFPHEPTLPHRGSTSSGTPPTCFAAEDERADGRLGQELFRWRVLRAYRECCAVCHLRHSELLDAAHILPDRHPKGEPIVPNGLAMCKLHHAAFDSHFLGVRPDLSIELRRDILDETDGPMLRYGLQGFHGKLLHAPRTRGLRPSVDFLAERFELFRKAG